MTAITIRPMRDGDAPALALIFHRAVQEGSAGHDNRAQRDGWSPTRPSAAGWRERLAGLATFVAEAEDGAAGFVSSDLRGAPGDPREGLVDLLFVRPDLARRGIGGALLARATGDARAAGMGRLVAEASALSAGLFRKAGWSETGTRGRGEGAARVANLLFARDL